MALHAHEIKTIDDLVSPGTALEQTKKQLKGMPKYYIRGAGISVAAALAIYGVDYVPKVFAYNYNVPFSEWAESAGLSIMPILIWGFYCVGKAFHLLKKAQMFD